MVKVSSESRWCMGVTERLLIHTFSPLNLSNLCPDATAWTMNKCDVLQWSSDHRHLGVFQRRSLSIWWLGKDKALLSSNPSHSNRFISFFPFTSWNFSAIQSSLPAFYTERCRFFRKSSIDAFLLSFFLESKVWKNGTYFISCAVSRNFQFFSFRILLELLLGWSSIQWLTWSEESSDKRLRYRRKRHVVVDCREPRTLCLCNRQPSLMHFL